MMLHLTSRNFLPSVSFSKPSKTPAVPLRRTFAKEGAQELLVEGITPKLGAGRPQPRRRFRSLADDLEEMFGKEDAIGGFDTVVPGDLYGIRSSFIDDLNHRILGSVPSGIHPDWEPTAAVYQKADSLMVCLELPGVEKSDIKIELDDQGVLTVQGEKKSPIEEGAKVYEQEMEGHGKFFRTFPLPEGVDVTKPKAEFKNGLLKVSFPRTQPPEETLQIPIEDA